MHFTTIWRQWKKEQDALAVCHYPHHCHDPPEHHHMVERDANRDRGIQSQQLAHFWRFCFQPVDVLSLPSALSAAMGSRSRAHKVEETFVLETSVTAFSVSAWCEIQSEESCSSWSPLLVLTKEQQSSLSSSPKSVLRLVQTQKLVTKDKNSNLVRKCRL